MPEPLLLNLLKAQNKMVKWQTKAVLRSFKPGDEVLFFLPIPGSPLKSKYIGPYKVERKLGKVNYVISTPDRKKDTQMIHVNLIKPYFSRLVEEGDQKTMTVISVERREAEPETEFNYDVLPSISPNPVNSQYKHISSLLSEFPKVTADLPGSCCYIHHVSSCNLDRDLSNRRPIKLIQRKG